MVAFSLSPKDLSQTVEVRHKLETAESAPIRQHPRRM